MLYKINIGGDYVMSKNDDGRHLSIRLDEQDAKRLDKVKKHIPSFKTDAQVIRHALLHYASHVERNEITI